VSQRQYACPLPCSAVQASAGTAEALRKAVADFVTDPACIEWSGIKLGSRLGKGGMGEVYACTWNGADTALKIMSTEGASADAVESFFREIRIHKDLNHPYIVRVYGVPIDQSVDPPKVGILMERMHCSLSDAPKNASRPFPLRERVSVLSQVAAGLVFLHGRKPSAIIHADLKAMNVLLADTAKGYQAKLADFGLAALKLQVRAHHMAGAAGGAGGGGAGASPGSDTSVGGGTLPFMAPELFTGGSHSARSDVYAFGIMMWEVLAGKFPYEGDPRRAGVRDQRGFIAFLKSHRPDMAQIDHRTPRRVRALMARCWHDEVAQRPLMTEVFEELERAVQECPDPRGAITPAAAAVAVPPQAHRPPAPAAPAPAGPAQHRGPAPGGRAPVQPPPLPAPIAPAQHTAAGRGECTVM